MAAFSEAQGALFRYDDFAELHGQARDARLDDYRGYQIYKNASSTQGPAELFALNMLEGYDLKAMGLNSADYIHTNAEALKLAMGDREKYLGDTDFIKIPFDGLLSKDYAAERRKLIDPNAPRSNCGPAIRRRFMCDTPGDFVDYPYTRDCRTATPSHAGDTSYMASWTRIATW